MIQTTVEPLFEWNDEYLIGIEELDYEHRDLINRLNELHGELTQHDEKGKIEDCLREIQVRVVAHFALEEHFMVDNNFYNYAPHKKEHDDFLALIADLIEKFLADPELSYGDELEKQLQHWIVNHILTSDQELALAIMD
jgi:hemerythrin